MYTVHNSKTFSTYTLTVDTNASFKAEISTLAQQRWHQPDQLID